MSIIPQAYRLTSGDGKMLTPDTLPKDFYPAPGEYDVHLITALTRSTPHYPLLQGSPKKTFGSQIQRPSATETLSPVRNSKPPGPGSYEVAHQLGSDLPGAVKDYHAEYVQVAKDMVDGRRKVGLENPGVITLSKAAHGIFETAVHPLDDDDPDNDLDDGTGVVAATKPRDDTANRFQTPAPDPYTWMLGPGSYDDATMIFGAAMQATNKLGQTVKEQNANKTKQASWGRTPNIEALEHETTATQLVSADRLPSEQFIVGYKSDDKHKDFNKIYKDVSEHIARQRVHRMKETKVKGKENQKCGRYWCFRIVLIFFWILHHCCFQDGNCNWSRWKLKKESSTV